MISLYVEAPFAVFRIFTAGYFRPTARFMPPSSAYGLLLNIAGIEMRWDDGKSEMTLIRSSGLPGCRLALGTPAAPEVRVLYQQLHNYPVGAHRKENADRCKGSKYNIKPVKRELLCDLKAYILVDGEESFEAAIRDGLSGKVKKRYGLPFLGDNNFLPNRLDLTSPPEEIRWWERLDEDAGTEDGTVTTRMTQCIHRSDMTQTRSALYILGKPRADVPERAWTEMYL
ncbi:MAG TPA: CRISPR-associated protein Cas5 [Candidatus Hydrogenedentes bacterium]|jgi:CRISPR-associated protein Cas5t|nr:MAG: hypothetical protein BWY07_02357 [Candidatus Hydrogenedentes bacterium ADurb.Bin170]HNZ49431.1 CRISPR-associated protein Cas5 [Candidatus Hydrogenedentota bacterium]HOD96301.1 CRISPR-associated protein Cas5 [Candidatus Hydrogenedentota bacterium]HOR51300.1 CRISPR-associated protein Cas5 [Candidatus Hydrogenedentota bacterium]HPK25729.1 CRISPR-associated protein Cas5 [Candidatus Hydrogenedentota bacterium]